MKNKNRNIPLQAKKCRSQNTNQDESGPGRKVRQKEVLKN